MHSDARAQQLREDLSETGAELEVADGCGDGRLLLLGGEGDRLECLSLGHGLALGEMDNVNGGAVS